MRVNILIGIIVLLVGCAAKIPGPATSNNLIADLSGEWIVTATESASFLNFLGDKKLITGSNGHNIVSGKKWGYFTVQVGAVEGELILNYGDQRNSALLRKVRDIIHRSGEGWAGTFFLSGKRIFEFRLDR